MSKSPRILDITTIRKVASLIAGNYRTSFKGVGIEFDDLREYSFGDDVHDIDWLSSAKTGKLFVKKYEEERELTTLFLIDSGENMLFGSGEKRKKDTLIEIFLTLAFSGLKGGDSMGALFFSDTILKEIPPKKSRVNFSLMIENLQMIENVHQGKVSVALEKLYLNKTRNHLIFILSDSLDTLDEKYMRALAQRNDIVWFHIFDSYENTLALDVPIHLADDKKHLITSSSEKKRLAYEKLRFEKILAFEKTIRHLGGDYLRFDEHDNIFKRLFQFFKKRQSRI